MLDKGESKSGVDDFGTKNTDSGRVGARGGGGGDIASRLCYLLRR